MEIYLLAVAKLAKKRESERLARKILKAKSVTL